ncbi:MAG TPA: DUF4440 domain-containing protein [Granulicella sp.]
MNRVLRLMLLGLTLTAAAALPAQQQQEPLHTATRQELDVVKVMLKQEEAWNKGDINGFIEGYKSSPDTLFVTNQIIRGIDNVTASYRQSYTNKDVMGTLSFSEIEVHALGDNFATCVGKYHLERSKKSGGNADGIFSLVFEKTEQGWKIVLDHTT